MSEKTYTFKLFKDVINEYYASKEEFTPRQVRRRMQVLSDLRNKPLSPAWKTTVTSSYFNQARVAGYITRVKEGTYVATKKFDLLYPLSKLTQETKQVYFRRNYES
nr:MAG TPA: hypothetical protein [Caudoviricetes sp.]